MKKLITSLLIILAPFSSSAYFDDIFEVPEPPVYEDRKYDYYDYLYAKNKGYSLRLDYKVPDWLEAKKTNKKLWIECIKPDKINTFVINVFTDSGYLMWTYDDARKRKKSYYFRDDYRKYVKDWKGKAYYVSSCDFSPVNDFLGK